MFRDAMDKQLHHAKLLAAISQTKMLAQHQMVTKEMALNANGQPYQCQSQQELARMFLGAMDKISLAAQLHVEISQMKTHVQHQTATKEMVLCANGQLTKHLQHQYHLKLFQS